MKKLIIANFKMNFNQEETKDYLKSLLSLTENSENEIAICAPYTVLSVASQMLFQKPIKLGAQNVHQEEKGAYTGEISARMLKDFNCEYVLVGHSERRIHFEEKNKIINQKIKVLLKFGLKPVLCIGEDQKEKLAGKTEEVLKQQLEQALQGLYENELSSIVIAYEPVWAIGTGKTPTAKQANDTIKSIRNFFETNYSAVASKKMSILYGGSVKAENAKTFLQQSEINGALVGSASLNADEFAKIAN